MFYGKEFVPSELECFSDRSGIGYRRLISCLKAANTEDVEQECASVFREIILLTLLHSERPTLYAILASLSAIGLNREDWSNCAEVQPNFTVHSQWHSYSCDVGHLSALRIVFC